MLTEMSPPAILTLVRHGETPANIASVYHGSTDTPLTERGMSQANRVASYLEVHREAVTAIYTSHLQRAWNTAGAIARELGLAARIESDLQEYGLGVWEGLKISDLHHRHDFWNVIRSDPDFAPDGGESPRQVRERFIGALRRIANSHQGERVVVVTHGGALSMVLGELIDGDYTSWERVMDNCGVSELTLDPAPALLSFNHTDHLTGL